MVSIKLPSVVFILTRATPCKAEFTRLGGLAKCNEAIAACRTPREFWKADTHSVNERLASEVFSA